MASPIRGFKIAAGMRIKMSQKNSKPEVSFAIDAWSQGQVRSKMWLLETLEPLARNDRHSQIWILGGWYGLLAFMLFTRNQIQPHLVTSFDIDPDANKKAEVLNNSWAFDPIRFTAKTADCMKLDFQLNKPDVVINTSCEHFPWKHFRQEFWSRFNRRTCPIRNTFSALKASRNFCLNMIFSARSYIPAKCILSIPTLSFPAL
jgi:hypothetical protein